MKTKVYDNKRIRESIVKVGEVLMNTVCSTMGPNGKTCVLDKNGGTPHVTKDGVTVSEFINFGNGVDNAVYKLIKESSRKTGETVGDGTTTSMFLAVKMLDMMLKNPDLSIIDVEEQVKRLLLFVENEIIIIGDTFSHHQTINHMVYKGEKIKNILKKRYDSAFKINMRVNKEVFEGDKIYIIYKTHD